MLRILHLEDCLTDRELIRQTLVKQCIRCELRWVTLRDDFARVLADVPLDLVLSDGGGLDFDGKEALALVRQMQPEAVFVFVTGQCKEVIAGSLTDSGADGIVRKDNLTELSEVLPAAFERRGRRYDVEL
jgi:CheY-like chemotaxis protein